MKGLTGERQVRASLVARLSHISEIARQLAERPRINPLTRAKIAGFSIDARRLARKIGDIGVTRDARIELQRMRVRAAPGTESLFKGVPGRADKLYGTEFRASREIRNELDSIEEEL